jgi:hypothetical protein
MQVLGPFSFGCVVQALSVATTTGGAFCFLKEHEQDTGFYS